MADGDDVRVSFDTYALQLAGTAATRGTCRRRHHGAVLVQQRRIVAVGYDATPERYPHCDADTCPRGTADGPGEPACLAVHAEAHALLSTGPEQRAGASLYSTGVPCFACATLIAHAGVAEVVAAGGRSDRADEVRDFLRACGVRVRMLDGLEGAPRLDLGSA